MKSCKKITNTLLTILQITFATLIYSQNISTSKNPEGITTIIRDSLGKVIGYEDTPLSEVYKIINWPEKFSKKNDADTLKIIYRNMSVTVVVHIVDFHKNKTEVYNQDFKLIVENYFDSLKLVKSIERFSSGQISHAFIEKSGIKIQTDYFESGMISRINIFDENNDHIILENDFDSTGAISSFIQYSESDSMTQWITYYPTGIISHESFMGNKVMPWISYYPDGSIWAEGKTYGTFANSYVGKYKEFYPNGSFKREEVYDEKIPNYRVGTWSWWDEKGNLIKQEIYKNNELIETKEFLPEVKEKEK